MTWNGGRILLMGRNGSGKTSMRSVIFSSTCSRDTWKFAPTMKIEKQPIKILSSFSLQLWDCGGQDSFLEDYLGGQSKDLFTKVATLVFVFDTATLLSNSESYKRDLRLFEQCASTLRSYSPDATIVVLFHKMDLIPNGINLKDRELELKKLALPTLVTQCFHTSIWDESLYRAWSFIMSSLLSNTPHLQAELSRLIDKLKAEEVCIFEINSMVELARSSKRHFHNLDSHRFEKISIIIKQLRMSVKRLDASPISVRLVTENGVGIIIEKLNDDALILVVIPGITQSRLLDISAEIESFKSIFTAVIEKTPEVDPHLL